MDKHKDLLFDHDGTLILQKNLLQEEE